MFCRSIVVASLLIQASFSNAQSLGLNLAGLTAGLTLTVGNLLTGEQGGGNLSFLPVAPTLIPGQQINYPTSNGTAPYSIYFIKTTSAGVSIVTTLTSIIATVVGTSTSTGTLLTTVPSNLTVGSFYRVVVEDSSAVPASYVYPSTVISAALPALVLTHGETTQIPYGTGVSPYTIVAVDAAGVTVEVIGTATGSGLVSWLVNAAQGTQLAVQVTDAIGDINTFPLSLVGALTAVVSLSLTQGQGINISSFTGTAPYIISFLTPSGAEILSVPATILTNITVPVNISGGTSVVVQVVDATGKTVTYPVTTVLPCSSNCTTTSEVPLLTECAAVSVAYAGGNGPFSINVISETGVLGLPLLTIPITISAGQNATAGIFDYLVAIPSGSNVALEVVNSLGGVVSYSPYSTVLAGNSTACLAGSATSSSSTGISSATAGASGFTSIITSAITSLTTSLVTSTELTTIGISSEVVVVTETFFSTFVPTATASTSGVLGLASGTTTTPLPTATLSPGSTTDTSAILSTRTDTSLTTPVMSTLAISTAVMPSSSSTSGVAQSIPVEFSSGASQISTVVRSSTGIFNLGGATTDSSLSSVPISASMSSAVVGTPASASAAESTNFNSASGSPTDRSFSTSQATFGGAASPSQTLASSSGCLSISSSLGVTIAATFVLALY